MNHQVLINIIKLTMKVFDFNTWRRIYYFQKMQIDLTVAPAEHSRNTLTSLIESYVSGLMWTFQYYYLGCPSWDWYYPYYYVPLASDLLNSPLVEIANRIVFVTGTPAQPFEQILSVLPPKNKLLLPTPLRHFMDDENSPLLDLFPPEVSVDREGKQFKSDFLLIVPFVDPQRFLVQIVHYS
jgi:5'-3' exonuclease